MKLTDLKMMKYILPVLLILSVLGLSAQGDITLIGQVTDADSGEGLPGATVLVKGTSNGTITDMDGNFTLTVPSWQGDAILTVSFVGFVSQEIKVNDQTTIKK